MTIVANCLRDMRRGQETAAVLKRQEEIERIASGYAENVSGRMHGMIRHSVIAPAIKPAVDKVVEVATEFTFDAIKRIAAGEDARRVFGLGPHEKVGDISEAEQPGINSGMTGIAAGDKMMGELGGELEGEAELENSDDEGWNLTNPDWYDKRGYLLPIEDRPPRPKRVFNPKGGEQIGVVVDPSIARRIEELENKIVEIEKQIPEMQHRNDRFHAQQKVEIYRQKIAEIGPEDERGLPVAGKRYAELQERHQEVEFGIASLRAGLDSVGMLVKTAGEEFDKQYERHAPEAVKDAVIDASAVLGMGVEKGVKQFDGDTREALAFGAKLASELMDEHLLPGERELVLPATAAIGGYVVGGAIKNTAIVLGRNARKLTSVGRGAGGGAAGAAAVASTGLEIDSSAFYAMRREPDVRKTLKVELVDGKIKQPVNRYYSENEGLVNTPIQQQIDRATGVETVYGSATQKKKFSEALATYKNLDQWPQLGQYVENIPRDYKMVGYAEGLKTTGVRFKKGEHHEIVFKKAKLDAKYPSQQVDYVTYIEHGSQYRDRYGNYIYKKNGVICRGTTADTVTPIPQEEIRRLRIERALEHPDVHIPVDEFIKLYGDK